MVNVNTVYKRQQHHEHHIELSSALLLHRNSWLSISYGHILRPYRASSQQLERVSKPCHSLWS